MNDKPIRKIVINTCFGGFDLSLKALKRFAELSGTPLDAIDFTAINRDDPFLVQVVEELGEEANGPVANLKIVQVPSDVNWQIANYDGKESVYELHRVWE